jgi:hypothetical protein
MVCLVITWVFLDIGRLISIYTIITLIGLNILAESIKSYESAGAVRFLNSNRIGKDFQIYAITFVMLVYLTFVSLITRVEHSNPQPNQIPLGKFLGLLK